MNTLRFGLCLALLACSPWVEAASRLSTTELSIQRAPSDAFRLEGLHRGEAAPTWLDLRPAQVFSEDAKLIVAGPDGERELPLPDLRHFIGTEQGDPSSRAFLSLAGDGSVRGWLQRGSTIEAFSREPGDRGGAPLEVVRVDLHGADVPQREYSCGTDDLGIVPGADHDHAVATADAFVRGGPVKLARVAVDTDHQYLGLFGGNTTNAARYAADVIGYSSMTYRNEVGYGLTLSYLRLWEGGTSPWQQTGSSCLLYEFGKHWNDNMGGVQRTIAHFMAGRSTGGGVAWVGVLCGGPFNTDVTGANCGALTGTVNAGGAYGFTGSISGNFNPGAPQVVWDILAVAHEIGHNFNSPHTHCYGNIPTSGLPPVDECATQSGANCFSGTPVLPGPQGQGTGTIMSYCHLRPGGYSNVTFTFGQGHAYGVQPDRVPTRMAAHAQARDSTNPTCFAVDDTIFANGFQ